MLVNPGDRGVHRHRPVQLTGPVTGPLDRGEDLRPGPILRPVREPTVDRVPVPEPLGDVPPRRTRAEPPHDPLQRAAHIQDRAADAPPHREQRCEHRPRLVRDLLPERHPPRLAETDPESPLPTRPRCGWRNRLWRATPRTPWARWPGSARSAIKRGAEGVDDPGAAGVFVGIHVVGDEREPHAGRRVGERGLTVGAVVAEAPWGGDPQRRPVEMEANAPPCGRDRGGSMTSVRRPRSSGM